MKAKGTVTDGNCRQPGIHPFIDRTMLKKSLEMQFENARLKIHE